MPKLDTERGTPVKVGVYDVTAEFIAICVRTKEWVDVGDVDFAASQALGWLDSTVYEARRARG